MNMTPFATYNFYIIYFKNTNNESDAIVFSRVLMIESNVDLHKNTPSEILFSTVEHVALLN